MNLKEALKQLADIREEIKLLNKKIKKLEPKSQETVCDVVDSTTKSPVMLCHTKIYGQDARIQKRIEKYRNILSTRYNKLLEVLDSAKALVNNVYNSLENADKPIKFYEELLDILKEVK